MFQGLDYSDVAIEYCQQKDLKVLKAELPDLSMIENESVDLFLLFDVLEHIDEDEFTLNVIKSKLKKADVFCLRFLRFLFCGLR